MVFMVKKKKNLSDFKNLEEEGGWLYGRLIRLFSKV
jgi:hypothetical protein